jgi:hypothetical protein
MELAIAGWRTHVRAQVRSQIFTLGGEGREHCTHFQRQRYCPGASGTIVQTENLDLLLFMQNGKNNDWGDATCILKLEEVGDEYRNRGNIGFSSLQGSRLQVQAYSGTLILD